MANVKISTINTTQGYQQPVNPNADGVVAKGFYPQNATSNDANAGIERGASEELSLKAGGSSVLTVIPPAAATNGVVQITNSSAGTTSLLLAQPDNDVGTLQIWGSGGGSGGGGGSNAAVNINGYPTATSTTVQIWNEYAGNALRVTSLSGSQPALLVTIGGTATGEAINAIGTIAGTTFSGSGALLTNIPNSATTATSSNTASAIVARDASGNFSAGTITASLNGNATTATSATSASSATNATNAANITLADVTTAASYRVPFGLTANNVSALRTATTFLFNPNTGRLSATSFGGSGAGLTSIPNSATTATSANTASAIVARDASGGFSAGNVVATGLAIASGSASADNVTVVASTTGAALRITQLGAGECLRVEDSANLDTTPFVVTATGDVGVGTSSPAGTLGVQRAAATAGWVVTGKSGGISNDSGIYADASNNMELAARNGSGTLTLRLGSSGDSYLTGGSLGIGSSTPGAKLDVQDSGNVTARVISTSASVASYTSIQAWAYTGGQGGHPVFAQYTARGTQASPAAIGSTDTLGVITFNGADATATPVFREGARISVIEAGAPSAGALTTVMTFSTANNAAATERARFTAAGHLLPGADNTYTFGVSATRWKELWTNAASINTSDARQKTDVADSDLGLDFINALRPVRYRWKVGQNVMVPTQDGVHEDGTPRMVEVLTPQPGVRPHYGFLAQDVKEVLGDRDFGGYIHDAATDAYGLRYEEFVGPLVKAVQELTAKVKQLEERLAAKP